VIEQQRLPQLPAVEKFGPVCCGQQLGGGRIVVQGRHGRRPSNLHRHRGQHALTQPRCGPEPDSDAYPIRLWWCITAGGDDQWQHWSKLLVSCQLAVDRPGSVHQQRRAPDDHNQAVRQSQSADGDLVCAICIVCGWFQLLIQRREPACAGYPVRLFILVV